MLEIGNKPSMAFERVENDGRFLRMAVLGTSGLTEQDILPMLAVLDAPRRSIMASIRAAPQRRDAIAAHFLLRRVLQHSLGVPARCWYFGATGAGRPVVLAPAAMRDIRVTLSHARGLVAVAVARGFEIGVDVERIGTDPLRLEVSDRFFAPAEASYLRGLRLDPALEAVTVLWTLKEAFVKAIGKGFGQPFRSFSISLSEPIRMTFDDTIAGDPDAWRFWRGSRGAFRLALAYSPIAHGTAVLSPASASARGSDDGLPMYTH